MIVHALPMIDIPGILTPINNNPVMVVVTEDRYRGALSATIFTVSLWPALFFFSFFPWSYLLRHALTFLLFSYILQK